MRWSIPCFPPASFEADFNFICCKQGRRLVRHGVVFVASFLLLIGAVTRPGASGKAQDEQSAALEPGKPIERELAGGEAHFYRLTLAAGQYARVFIDQRRINVAASAFDPDGKKLVEADMFAVGDAERVLLIAETAGTYRLELRSPDQTAPKGRYEIRIKELRTVTEQDKSLVAAERLIAEGILLAQGPTADSWRKAIDKYQQAIPFSQSAKEPAWEATALYLISNVYLYLTEKQKAFDFANQALPIAQAAAKQPDEERRRLGIKVEANTLDTIGAVHNEFGDKKKAIEWFTQALPLRQATGDRAGEANTLNSLAKAYQFLGDYLKALDLSNQARLIFSELGDRGREATALNNLCVIHDNLGEYKKALDFCHQSLSIIRQMKSRWSEATALNNIGNIYSRLGEYQKTLDSYLQSHAIHRAMGELRGQGIALSNIGWAYDTLGEYEKAIASYTQAMEIFRAAGDQYREANVLSNLAVGYANIKDFRKALDVAEQALLLRRAQGNRGGEAITLNNIAGAYSNLGDKQKALDYYNQSLALHRAVGNSRHMANTLRNLGDLHRELGEHQKALNYFHESLQMARAAGDRDSEAATLAFTARLERDRGNLIEARNHVEAALAAVESLRFSVKSHPLRASFFASVRKYHELHIDLLMRLHKQQPAAGFDAAALQASEQGRARSLLELLAEAGAEIRQGVDSSLVERERILRQQISDKADRQMRLLGGKHTDEEAAAAAKEMDALTTEHQQVEAQIRQTSPRYAALTQPAPLTLKEIQSQALDDETLLLEYALGEKTSFLWAVTPTSINSFELPKREEIETAARRVYEMLTARNRTVANETPEQRRKRLEQAGAEYPKASAALSQMLLGSVASELKSKRLVIVGEGILQYVPFAALPEINRSYGTYGTYRTEGQPLITNHEIINLPSASVLAVLRREAAGRKTSDRSVAVFADPVFHGSDPRVGQLSKGQSPAVEATGAASEVKRSATESGLLDFVRLRFSRQEADRIIRFASEGRRLEAVDFAANRATATSPELARYAIIHFATHGLINNQNPELSGIILSLVDEQGRSRNGFLRLYDIYNLKLAADLVVLSACQTALGKEIKGEGLVGLTRGFMYAGAPRVVASLWQIDDRATAELMGRFYEAMFRQGLRPAAALRSAQVSMWKEKRWQAPHSWAAFTFQGEWK
jgi:CHAT domain-containing protein